TEEEKGFWAYQPMKEAAPPQTAPQAPSQAGDEAWAHSPIDRFILRKLEERNFTPAPPADKLTLLRRATFDLTGLPPTGTETADFLADPAPRRVGKGVGGLLARSAYRGSWGRYWADVGALAGLAGNDEDHRYPHAWKYRDYVIESFNNDLPYDQFIR